MGWILFFVIFEIVICPLYPYVCAWRFDLQKLKEGIAGTDCHGNHSVFASFLSVYYLMKQVDLMIILKYALKIFFFELFVAYGFHTNPEYNCRFPKCQWWLFHQFNWDFACKLWQISTTSTLLAVLFFNLLAFVIIV